MEGVLPFLITGLVLLGLAAAVGGVIYYVIRARSGEAVSFPLRLLFRAYLYIISIISIVILVVGGASLVRAGLGATLGKEFSYSSAYIKFVPRPVVPEETPKELTPEEEEVQLESGLDRAFKEGILDGLSSIVVGALVLGLHMWGRRRLESEEDRTSMLNRVYLILLLVIFGIVALTALPMAINDTLRYYILDLDEFSRVVPGSRLAMAIVTVPVWAYYLYATLRALRREEATAPAAGGG